MEKINIALSGLTVSIESLFPDPKNARKHGEKSIKAIMRSLEEYGQQKPICALPTGQVIAGNGMLEAAKRLGWGKIAVVVFDSAEKAGAYALVDNRSSELSAWNEDILTELSQGIDLKELAGFDEKFMKKYIQEGLTAEKVKKQIQCPHCQEWLDLPKRGRKVKGEQTSP